MSSEPRLCVIFLDILPPQWIFPPFASSICLLCSSPPLRNRVSQNGCWERSGMRRAACSRTPSLSLSLAFTLPRTCLLPASSLHLPTLSFSLSSSPSLSYTHTHRHTLLQLGLFTITAVPLPAMSDRKIHRPYSSEKQIMLDKHVKLNRYEAAAWKRALGQEAI